jgi:hypothetical protein
MPMMKSESPSTTISTPFWSPLGTSCGFRLAAYATQSSSSATSNENTRTS